MVYTQNVVLLSHNKQGNPAICDNVDNPGCYKHYSGVTTNPDISHDGILAMKLEFSNETRKIHKNVKMNTLQNL